MDVDVDVNGKYFEPFIFEYTSPPAVDELEDEILITFDEINLLAFATTRINSDDSFTLIISKTHVKESGRYPVTVYLKDDYSPDRRTDRFFLVVTLNVRTDALATSGDE